MRFQISAPLSAKLSPAARGVLETTVNGAAYRHQDPDYCGKVLDYLALCVLDDGKLKGAFLNSVYQQDPALLPRISAEKTRHAALIESLQDPPREAGAHQALVPAAPRRIVDTDEAFSNDVSAEDVAFADYFRTAFNEEEGQRAAATEQRRLVSMNTDPAQETAEIMAMDNPYDRVRAAASRMREGRRMNPRGLHFLKS